MSTQAVEDYHNLNIPHEDYCDCGGDFSVCCDNEANYSDDNLLVHKGIKMMEKIIKTQRWVLKQQDKEIKKLKKRVKKLQNRQIVNMNLMSE